MSILIKGMKMPKDCGACDLCYDYVDCMAASSAININFETRPKECPLIEVPSKHGRLIDAEKLDSDLITLKTRMAGLAHINKEYKYREQAIGLYRARILSHIQPTIIEAEGEVDNERH